MAERNDFTRVISGLIDVDDIWADLYNEQRNRSMDNMCRTILKETASKDLCFRTDQIINMLLTHSRDPNFYQKYILEHQLLLKRMKRENMRAPVYNKTLVKFFNTLKAFKL